MNDIYDIKDIFIGFPINVLYSLLFISFLIILLVFYKNILEKKPEQIRKVNIIKEKVDFSLIILDFEKGYLDLKSSIFYAKLLEILRKILEEKWNKNISKMTFEQINNLNLDDSLKNMIKSIYYKEYTEKIEDNKEIRLDFIKEIKKLII